MDLAFPPASLSQAESSRVVAVRALFLEFILGILTQLMSGVPRGAAPSDAKATLRTKPDLVSIAFYEQLVDTQAFQQLFTAWTKVFSGLQFQHSPSSHAFPSATCKHDKEAKRVREVLAFRCGCFV